MKSLIRTIALPACVLLVAGCQNVFRDAYRPVPVDPDMTLSQYSGATRAQYSSDFHSDYMRLVDGWYAPLGSSSFQTRTTEELAQWVAQGMAQRQGRAVGADIVLWSDTFLG